MEPRVEVCYNSSWDENKTFQAFHLCMVGLVTHRNKREQCA